MSIQDNLFDSNELLLMRVPSSMRVTCKGAYGIDSDWQFSPSKRHRYRIDAIGSKSRLFDPKLNGLPLGHGFKKSKKGDFWGFCNLRIVLEWEILL